MERKGIRANLHSILSLSFSISIELGEKTFSIKKMKEKNMQRKKIVSNNVLTQIYQFLTVDRTEQHKTMERIERERGKLSQKRINRAYNFECCR